MEFDWSDEETQMAAGLSLLFTFLMAIFMFSVSTWDHFSLTYKVIILVAGLPIYFIVAKIVLEGGL